MSKLRTRRASVSMLCLLVVGVTLAWATPRIYNNGAWLVESEITFPEIDPRGVGDPTRVGIGGVPGCSPEIHDLYGAVGPDGKTYRTWHALWHPRGVDGIPTMEQIVRGKDDPECYFAHEHGDPPLAITKPETGAPLPLFGYAAVRTMGRTEAHFGYKVVTHLSGQKTGWHAPELGWVSDELFLTEPDWDMEAVVHQGAPSLKTDSREPGATRVTQRFHEFNFWSKDPEGRVTSVRVMADTQAARGVSLCGALSDVVLDSNLDFLRLISDGCGNADPHVYENWIFPIHVGDVWYGDAQMDVNNPMDFVVDYEQQIFESASEICANGRGSHLGGVVLDPNECEGSLPFGDPRVPAAGFMGTMRDLISPGWKWSNQGGPEFVCTDGYGDRVEDARCDEGDPLVIRQQVAQIDYFNEYWGDTGTWESGIPGLGSDQGTWETEGDGVWNRGERSSTWDLAFPYLTLDPARPHDCAALECDYRMPQGAPLGN